MRLPLPILVLIVLLVFGKGKGALDFSQFYLPPCCLSPPIEPFSGYASKTLSITSKREVPKLETISKNASVKAEYDNLVVLPKNANTKIRFYSLIIPIDDVLISKQVYGSQRSQKNYQRNPSTIGRILFPEGRSDSIFDPSNQQPRNSLAASKILEKIFNAELSTTDDIKRIIRRKSLPTSESVEPTQNILREHLSEEPHIQSRIVDHYINWESKKLTGNDGFRNPEDNRNSPKLLQTLATEQQHQIVKQIPSSWVKYLKRALYQSITDGKGIIESSSEFRNRNNAAESKKSKIRFPETWKTIKSAQTQYVDKMAQVSTSPFGTIYLPPEEGPIVSGVLVNSHDGNLYLRVASELYFPNPIQQHPAENCGCYLLQPGEILVAYWSVTRIFKDNGQPALQYLVYPLPYSVPTPPEFLPFSNSAMFSPSSIDPFANFYENIQHSQQTHIGPPHPPPPPEHPLHHHSKGHGHNMIRNPKPFPNDEIFLENLNHQHQSQLGIIPNSQPRPILPDPTDVPGGQVPKLHYPPELLEQYQLTFQNAFNEQLYNGQANNAFHSIPYKDLNVHGPIHYELPNQMQPPPAISSPVINRNHDLALENTEPPTPPPTDLPAPVPDMQLSKPPTFPKSIQDIISPQQQPLHSQQMTPEIQSLVVQPTPGVPISPEHYPFFVNLPPHFPPAYMNFNMFNPGIVQGLKQNEERQNTIKQTDGTEKDKISNNDTEHKADNPKTEQIKDTKYGLQRPYMISNLLDNEKKYYPIRQPQNSALKYYKYRYERQRRFHKQKLVNHINSQGGYLLDF